MVEPRGRNTGPGSVRVLEKRAIQLRWHTF
jgi:hypothetical protein